jgi:hypothetical protein
MIWAILAFLGVPLWLCAAGISVLVFRNRKLRRRAGSVPARIRVGGKGRWHPGHGLWVHDVFAFRAGPAAWKQSLVQVASVSVKTAGDEEKKGLHRLGEDVVIATLELVPKGSLEHAARAEHVSLLLGPFAKVAPVSESATAASQLATAT